MRLLVLGVVLSSVWLCQAWDPWNLTPTPPMGWANWNTFACDYNDTIIRQTADMLVSTGLRDAGYKVIIIQECITKQGQRREDGTPMPDRDKFPLGMKSLVDYIHDKGLLAGIYTDVGKLTCAKYEGSFDHERIDALTYAKWGIDFIEVDACFLPPNHTHMELYGRMRDSIVAAKELTGHKMILYMCTSGPASHKDVHIWGPKTGNLWRTTGDICSPGQADWNRMLGNFRGNLKFPKAQGPGIGWQDPDMLVVGMKGLNSIEWQTHFTLWAMVSAPLWIGVDLRTASKQVLSILSNREVIAIDQDPNGIPARLLRRERAVEVWEKPLQPIATERVASAIAVVNFGETDSQSTTLPFTMFERFNQTQGITCRELMSRQESCRTQGITIRGLRPHESVLLRLTQTSTADVGMHEDVAVIYEAYD